jgi:hypothetical protein
MRVLLRDSKTSLYYAGFNQWAAEDRNGVRFSDLSQALDLCERDRLDGMDIVLLSESPRSEFLMPVSQVHAHR